MAGVGDDRRAAAEALLGWYEAIGVDAIVLPDAVDRFAVAPKASTSLRRSLPASKAASSRQRLASWCFLMAIRPAG